MESGKLTLSPLTFSIVETAENLVNISQPMIKEKNIDFNFRIDRMEKEYLYADQLRLNQIYINILSNAIKYTQPGGRVSVDLREEESAVPGCPRSAVPGLPCGTMRTCRNPRRIVTDSPGICIGWGLPHGLPFRGSPDTFT